MSYGRERDPYFRPDPYARRDHRPSRTGYGEVTRFCGTCSRHTVWMGAGREDPAVDICTDCGTEGRFV